MYGRVPDHVLRVPSGLYEGRLRSLNYSPRTSGESDVYIISHWSDEYIIFLITGVMTTLFFIRVMNSLFSLE